MLAAPTPTVSIPAASHRRTARGRWNSCVRTVASSTPNTSLARAHESQVENPAWSPTTRSAGMPASTR